ncbi:MAG: YdeI/OmpD-associated family protein [Rubrobacteraceae bacterium]
MANKTSKKSTRVAKPALLAGGNPQIAKADGDGPEVLRFEAQLFQHPKTAAAKTDFQTLLDVPEWVGKQFPSRGMTRVEGTINGHPFRAALEPNASGSHRLRVNKAMLKGAGADAGDTVKLAILGPEPEPTVPADLRVALAASHEARTLWDDLTTMGRRDWIRWIESARQPETRTRRVTRTVEQLSSGKRRACCVNVYEFMLCRIQEEEQTEES